MIIGKKALPRRTFLRGVGATLALPLLDAMIPAMTAEAATVAAPVRRLGFVFIPMGCDNTRWTPPGGTKTAVPQSALRLPDGSELPIYQPRHASVLDAPRR